MKRNLVAILVLGFVFWNIPAYGLSEAKSEHLRDMRVQPDEPKNAPRWTDYVPAKYENPRTDFTFGSASKEMIWGAILTDLIVTAPIGIPILCHGRTKFNNYEYAEKKAKFFDGLEEAKNLPEEEQERYYKELLKKCGLEKKYID